MRCSIYALLVLIILAAPNPGTVMSGVNTLVYTCYLDTIEYILIVYRCDIDLGGGLMCGVTFKNQPSVRGKFILSICLAYLVNSTAVIVVISIREAVNYIFHTGSAYANNINSGQLSTN